MKVIDSKFIESAYKFTDLSQSEFPEIAFIGRSNVGKSSLINTLLQRKNLAQISKKPGKTRTINIFEVSCKFNVQKEKINFADLPGYGYAKISEKTQHAWKILIDDYISRRKNLCGLILIVDLRHNADKKDIEAKDWIASHRKEMLLVPTKADKLSKSQAAIKIRMLKDQFLLLPQHEIIGFSSKSRIGREEILEWIGELTALVKNGEVTC
ncbi:MAG: ribosome biogenesis GTP-binding protein YihA/YsxC [Candidatus Celaenobacter antarcticus]|nr:ribosome biogenesis GTP-binding protein YihA/YsxC [Candidatus Celaenobacter antarcticus]